MFGQFKFSLFTSKYIIRSAKKGAKSTLMWCTKHREIQRHTYAPRGLISHPIQGKQVFIGYTFQKLEHGYHKELAGPQTKEHQ